MQLFWRLTGYLKPYAGQAVLGAVLLALSGALTGAVVSTVKPLINELLLGDVVLPGATDGTVADGPDILDGFRRWLPTEGLFAWAREHAFVQLPLLVVLIYLIKGIFAYFGLYLTIRVGAAVIRDVRAELYEAVTYQSLSFYQTNSSGLIMSRILNDVQRIHHLFTTDLVELVRVGGMVPFLLLTAFLHEWRMSLAAVLALPLLAYPMVRLGRRLRRASTASQEHMARVASRLSEAVGGVKVVQGFGMERYEVSRFREALEGMLGADLKAGRAKSLAPAVMELVAASIGAGMFFLAGRTIAGGGLDPGNFMVVLLSLGLLFMSTRRINRHYAELQVALAAAARVYDMIDGEREIRDMPAAREISPFREEIRFDEVDFSYGDELVLDRIDAVIRKSETVALVGASGSGKSTMANLLLRFYDPTRGAIRLDGQDIREVTLRSLRAQTGLVTQETVLFDDSVRDNIAYGRNDVQLDRVIEVARAAHAHDFIEKLPQGYDTMLGERGARLSMGQRQRVTIARALLKDPPILILDEATSALDAESESLVQAALEVLMQGRTSLVIAHRLATVRNADRILVLARGRIVETGTHHELLDRGGAYSRLYRLQFEEQDR